MGFTKTFARWGAVGGTARTVAKGYLTHTKNDPTVALRDTLRYIIEVRYLAIKNNWARNSILHQIDRDWITTLTALTIAILKHEADYDENTPENQAMFKEVIIEELKGLSVPPGLI